MKFAKHMEAFFVAAVVLLCASAYHTEPVASTAHASVAAQGSAMAEGA